MRILVQKSLAASVSVDDQIVAAIPQGYVLLVGITGTDAEVDLQYLAKKVAMLRIYPDADGKLNQSIRDHGGEILSISQFTLYGDASEGNRPSFTAAAPGDVALPLFERFNEILSSVYGLTVATGVFGAHMKVSLINDGPTTLWLESKKKPLESGKSI